MAVKKLSWKTFNEQCIRLADKVIKEDHLQFEIKLYERDENGN